MSVDWRGEASPPGRLGGSVPPRRLPIFLHGADICPSLRLSLSVPAGCHDAARLDTLSPSHLPFLIVSPYPTPNIFPGHSTLLSPLQPHVVNGSQLAVNPRPCDRVWQWVRRTSWRRERGGRSTIEGVRSAGEISGLRDLLIGRNADISPWYY